MLIPSFDIKRDQFFGPAHARVELIQYGDYQCLHCGDTASVIHQLHSIMGDDLNIVFRHFPLHNLHPFALDAAVAAEAAGLQGKFWQMHFKILENQFYLNRSSFDWFAQDLKLDMVHFGVHKKSRHLFKKIAADLESGVHNGVNSTPTYFINGRRYNGFNDFPSLFRVCRVAAGYYKTIF
jgi:protein-disulfide isomerase